MMRAVRSEATLMSGPYHGGRLAGSAAVTRAIISARARSNHASNSAAGQDR